MEFRSVADLNADIVAWSETLPRDIDVVVGIPRSGMLVATLLGLHMDRPITDLTGYLAGRAYLGGKRTRGRHSTDRQHALVVDDSVWSGRAIKEAKAEVERAPVAGRTSYGAVYVHDRASAAQVDHWQALVPVPRIFEWNVLHHDRLPECCMDIDGVLCRYPSEEENDDGSAYAAYLQDVPARFVPGEEVGWLVTSRLERYRPETEAWLRARGIRYRELLMHPAANGAERRASGDHAERKARAYVQTGAWLFIESDASQALEIAQRSGKAVYCTDTRQLVQPSALSAARRQVADLPRLPARAAAKARSGLGHLRRRFSAGS